MENRQCLKQTYFILQSNGNRPDKTVTSTEKKVLKLNILKNDNKYEKYFNIKISRGVFNYFGICDETIDSSCAQKFLCTTATEILSFM